MGNCINNIKLEPVFAKKYRFGHRRLAMPVKSLERNKMKKYFLPFIMLVIFETIAVTLWLTQDNAFYLFNFGFFL